MSTAGNGFAPRELLTITFRSAASTLATFFFQAEDGIRLATVTGVQTCALPIFERIGRRVLELTGQWTTHDSLPVPRFAAVFPYDPHDAARVYLGRSRFDRVF